MRCPKCGSEQIESNLIPEMPVERVVELVTAGRNTQNPAMGVSAMLMWGGGRLINAFRHPWRCNPCHYKFG